MFNTSYHMERIKKNPNTNLERRSRESRCRGDAGENSILVIAKTMGRALDHNLRREHGVLLQGLHIGLLPDRPLARPKRILPPHVIPVVHVVRQHHHRRFQVEVAPPQPRHHQLRRGRGGAALGGEELHHHGTSPPKLLRRHVRRGGVRGVVVWGGGRGASGSEAREEARHCVASSRAAE